MSESSTGNITYDNGYGHCIHGTAPYMVCLKCAEMRRQEAREEKLYATLDRLAAAVDRLAAAQGSAA